MESVLHWVGIFLLIELALDVLLALALWLFGKRPAHPEAVNAGRVVLAASGCLTVCLALIYAGLWMLARA